MTNLTEPCPIPEVFACELARIERFGSMTRLIFATPQGSVFDSGTERVIVARLIVPTEQIPHIIAVLRSDARPLQPDEDSCDAHRMN